MSTQFASGEVTIRNVFVTEKGKQVSECMRVRTTQLVTLEDTKQTELTCPAHARNDLFEDDEKASEIIAHLNQQKETGQMIRHDSTLMFHPLYIRTSQRILKQYGEDVAKRYQEEFKLCMTAVVNRQEA